MSVLLIGGTKLVRRAPPVYLDHVYVVLDSQAVAALGSCAFVDTFTSFAVRTTVSGDRTWSGGVISGARTYVEVFSPGNGFGDVGSSGIGFSVEGAGALEDLAAAAGAAGIIARSESRTGRMGGREVRWFDALHLVYDSTSSQSALPQWIMEYDAEFISALLGDTRARDRSQLRRKLRARRFDVEKPLIDISRVELIADSAETARLRKSFEIYGWHMEQRPRSTFAAGEDSIAIEFRNGTVNRITSIAFKIKPGMISPGSRSCGPSIFEAAEDVVVWRLPA